MTLRAFLFLMTANVGQLALDQKAQRFICRIRFT